LPVGRYARIEKGIFCMGAPGTRDKTFAWQEGYAAFTVSSISRDAVRNYIANQEDHHRVMPFRKELAAMLEKAGVEYDPRYFD
jgi:hypothetical protein